MLLLRVLEANIYVRVRDRRTEFIGRTLDIFIIRESRSGMGQIHVFKARAGSIDRPLPEINMFRTDCFSFHPVSDRSNETII